MMRIPVRHAPKKAQQRPLALSILAVLGVSLGLAIAIAAMVYAGIEALGGGVAPLTMIIALFGLLVALVIIWFYWALWEMLSTAWWTHLILGPFAVLALALSLPFVPDAVRLIAGAAPEAVRSVAERGASGVLLALIVLECAVVAYLLANRSVFGIGRRKEVWER